MPAGDGLADEDASSVTALRCMSNGISAAEVTTPAPSM